MYTAKYSYVDLPEGQSQYSGIDHDHVNALYVRAENPCDQNNPFIEALPCIRSEDDWYVDATKSIVNYDFEKQKTWSTARRIGALSQLYTLRFILPFQMDLEYFFWTSLVESYRLRSRLTSNSDTVDLYVDGEKIQTHGITVGDSADVATSAFNLIGYSGAGKSSSIKSMLERYPQVIFHTLGEDCFPQIPYLVINIPPNSNFNGVYKAIARAIDYQLKNIIPVYQVFFDKRRTLIEMMEYTISLIEKLSIGILILDEIQNIDFGSTKENSFEAFLTMCNRTKVAVAIVGTEDAKNKMFPNLRTGRRLGPCIQASDYCMNQDFFNYLCDEVSEYQWFDDRVMITDEIKETMYELTQGIVQQLISLWKAVNYEYLRNRRRPAITASFIRKVFRKEYAGIEPLLKDLNRRTQEDDAALVMLDGDAYESMQKDAGRQHKTTKKILNENRKVGEFSRRKRTIVTLVAEQTERSINEVQKVFDCMYKNHRDLTDQALCRIVREAVLALDGPRDAEIAADTLMDAMFI